MTIFLRIISNQVTILRSAILFAVLFGLLSCSSQPEKLEFSGSTMGTGYSIIVFPNQKLTAEEVDSLREKIDRRLIEVNKIASTYIADSELSYLNRLIENHDFDSGDLTFEVSSELYHLLALSMDVSTKSQGSFDVTVGNLVNAWGFGPTGATINQQPESSEAAKREIERQLEFSGINALLLSKPSNIVVQRPVHIDLSAIAKGWGVDQVAEILVQQQLHRYLVEIGGEIRVGQAKPSGLWQIAIEKPTDDAMGMRSAYSILPVASVSVATSGDYRNYREIDNQRFSHMIDPKTGRPVQHGLASVTVMADSTAVADAWATALNVMGPQRALAAANTYNLAVILMSYQGSDLIIEYSTNFLASFPEPSNNM